MTATNDGILDYYLLPMAELTTQRLRLAEENGLTLDPYRFESLDLFMSLVRRSSISEAA
jgi:hypothetical protein